MSRHVSSLRIGLACGIVGSTLIACAGVLGLPNPELDQLGNLDTDAVSERALQPDAPQPDAAQRLDATSCAKSCFGQCVGVVNPELGCSASSCAACVLPHASATCAAGRCSIQKCEQGFADCDGQTPNGCEVDLSDARTCGECRRACSPTELCAPNGLTFACAASCGTLQKCGQQCVDATSNAAHCGGCDRPCPVAGAGATVTCSASMCKMTCVAGSHLCGSIAAGNASCASNLDVDRCGTNCVMCPARPNSTRTCVGGSCATTCDPGWRDCNGALEDGCESDLGPCP